MIEQDIKKDINTLTIDSTYTKPMTLTNQSFPGKKVLTSLALAVYILLYDNITQSMLIQACISNLSMYLFFTTLVFSL